MHCSRLNHFLSSYVFHWILGCYHSSSLDQCFKKSSMCLKVELKRLVWSSLADVPRTSYYLVQRTSCNQVPQTSRVRTYLGLWNNCISSKVWFIWVILFRKILTHLCSKYALLMKFLNELPYKFHLTQSLLPALLITFSILTSF